MTTGRPTDAGGEALHPATDTRTIEIPADQADGECWPAHAHDAHELMWAVSGRLSVTTPDAHFAVPPGASIWIPAGVEHEVRAAAGCRLQCTWLARQADLHERRTTSVLVTPPLFDRVMEHLLSAPLDAEERRRAEAFAVDLLRPTRSVDVDVPRPRTPALVAVADALARDPADRRTVQEWAASCAVSTRTFTRAFQQETGRGFAAWRRDLRIRAAMQRLAAGEPPGAVARATGFAAQASFTTTFREVTGTTPAAFARASARWSQAPDAPG